VFEVFTELIFMTFIIVVALQMFSQFCGVTLDFSSLVTVTALEQVACFVL
jgi:hypothetical protein